jgi:glycosyltransferase involved in cell wall biosynthesis
MGDLPTPSSPSPPAPARPPFAPPGWPRTSRPLRIAILGWARLALQEREGSGYNLSASELAAGLAMSGHHVSYLASGMKYRAIPGVHIRPLETWRGIECFDLINSPHFAPAAVNFRRADRETSGGAATGRVLRWLDQVRAQIVHIHSLEGLGLDIIGAIRQTGRPVMVTLHNYWFVCPQVDLLHREVDLCDDYQGGARCVGCLETPDSRLQRAKRTLGQTLEAVIGPGPADVVRKSAYGAIERLSGSARSARVPEPAPDPELARPWNAPAPDGDGTRIEHNLRVGPRERPARPDPLAPDSNERFLGEAPGTTPEGARAIHLRVVNGYGRRRLAGIDALNHASMVISPSDFLRRAHEVMGLHPQRAGAVRLGQPHFDQINRAARRSDYYTRRPWSPEDPRPLRFGFFGATRANKGLAVLVEAIRLLDPAVRRRCRFLIRAGGWDWPFRKLLADFPEAQFAGGYDLLQRIAGCEEYDVGVLPHIWFENSPLVLLEHLHAGRFTLCARLGGPVEWIVEPSEESCGNGLLFAGGDAAELAAHITSLARGEIPIPSRREVHDATPHLQSYLGHVREVESIYSELLDGAPSPTQRRATTSAMQGQDAEDGSPAAQAAGTPAPDGQSAQELNVPLLGNQGSEPSGASRGDAGARRA